MLSASGKADALLLCPPLATVLGRMGQMLSAAQVYVQDKDGNERRSYAAVRSLVASPNPIQSGSSFLSSVEISLRLYGVCPVFTVRAFPDSVPAAMYVIPVQMFHMVSTGRLFRQTDIGGIVEEAYLEWNGKREVLAKEDFFIISDSDFTVDGRGTDIRFSSVSDCLSAPVNGWIAAASASHRLISDGGPKGIVYSDYTDSLANQPMSPEEKKELEGRLARQYGILKDFPIAVSPFRLGWLPLDFNASQLKLMEQSERCERAIAAAYGINYSIFNDSKYDNQESAKRAAYQDVIIPDSVKIADSLTRHICPEGASVRLDYSGVSCLQTDRAKESETLARTASALQTLRDGGFISAGEARRHLASLMDIDPEENIQEDGDKE